MSVVILSYTKNTTYYKMLRDCIQSIGDDKEIIVVETNSKLKGKDMMLPAKFVFPEEEFNYNRFLNIGFEHISVKEKVIVSNNDVLYEPECIDLLYEGLNEYDSVSPTEAYHQQNLLGYKVGEHIKGWCIGLNYSVYEKMGGWDEDFKFWYQDDDYSNFLMHNSLKHAQIGKAVARHLVSKSHYLIDDIKSYTHDQNIIFEQKWGNTD